MALIHKATLNPTKLQLLASWLPRQTWVTDVTDLEQVGAYRFDDPAGVVGIEALLLQSRDGSVFHVPLTYRGAPLVGAEEFLIGTTEHSVLGTRWVYDGCGDPVWATALATAVLTGGTQAEELVDMEGRLQPRAATAEVRGSGNQGTPVAEVEAVNCREEGSTTVVRTEQFDLVVVRVIGTEVAVQQTLTGSWAQHGPAVLAGVRPI
ncbi:CG0192-related protein [Nocardioides sp. zg-1228]|uniref:CG0192-related protein n=1 Tax=Nocardioides sp. zg-1228 TaxID=2763008 RepID=UPI0016424023|nr:hypothetical protein [Nocardioides sp. zg-1228]MBC2934725.1 hypothetical protein [Nocardioides sp. zg-1228]QSF56040.1 hypothetical protein JX575_10085 [Nocardioides sp. zg-1228]